MILGLHSGCAPRAVDEAMQPLEFAWSIAHKCPLIPLIDVVQTSGDGKVICYLGTISEDTARAVRSLRLDSDSFVVVSSNGGDSAAAYNIANQILDAGASVIVRGDCLSACAGYIFVAGRRKYVLEHSLVGFHGDFDQTSADILATAPDGAVCVNHKDACAQVANGPQQFRQELARWVRTYLDAQNEFYTRLGVDPGLIRAGPGGMTFNPTQAFESVQGSSIREHTMWVYGPDVMERRFGVKGIRYYDYNSIFTGSFLQNIGQPTCTAYADQEAICRYSSWL